MSSQARHTAFTHFDQFLKPEFEIPKTKAADEEDFDPVEIFCPVPGVPDDPEKRIMGGFLSMTVDEMVEIFDPVVKEAAALVQAQVAEAEKRSGHGVTRD
ncbi:hypothetical protein BDZ91DRAFT_44688 [Kalaharituber pfeilii]|nr:hypothetical protein BDZ91DRAFT_44688 [Kalaharituber pfeilii]